MPLYTFQAESGSTIDLPFSMAEVPSIGESVDVDGIPHKRIFCGRVGDAAIAQQSKYPYLSHCLNPMGTLGVKKLIVAKTGKTKVLVESKKHEREIMAANDKVKD